jgi:predicted RNA polymerase sigma factor
MRAVSSTERNAHQDAAPLDRDAQATVDAVYRTESRAVLATLIRLLGDFDVAEEALHEAFRAALERWPRDGVPANPRAWLVSAGRFKAIDQLRRQSRFESFDDARHDRPDEGADGSGIELDDLQDDRLRLIFTVAIRRWHPTRRSRSRCCCRNRRRPRCSR